MNQLQLAKANCHQLKDNVLKLAESNGFNDLPKADTELYMALKKMDVLTTYGYESQGCYNTLHYYGHTPMANGYTGVVLGYAICSCCGDDQLILAVMDDKGKILSAIKVAQMENNAECTTQARTKMDSDRLIIGQKEECGILDGPSKDKMSVDSTTDIYTITPAGKFQLQKHDSVYIVRD